MGTGGAVSASCWIKVSLYEDVIGGFFSGEDRDGVEEPFEMARARFACRSGNVVGGSSCGHDDCDVNGGAGAMVEEAAL